MITLQTYSGRQAWASRLDVRRSTYAVFPRPLDEWIFYSKPRCAQAEPSSLLCAFGEAPVYRLALLDNPLNSDGLRLEYDVPVSTVGALVTISGMLAKVAADGFLPRAPYEGKELWPAAVAMAVHLLSPPLFTPPVGMNTLVRVLADFGDEPSAYHIRDDD